MASKKFKKIILDKLQAKNVDCKLPVEDKPTYEKLKAKSLDCKLPVEDKPTYEKLKAKSLDFKLPVEDKPTYEKLKAKSLDCKLPVEDKPTYEKLKAKSLDCKLPVEDKPTYEKLKAKSLDFKLPVEDKPTYEKLKAKSLDFKLPVEDKPTYEKLKAKSLDFISRDDHCPEGYVDDCSGDGDCAPEDWIGDGYCDGTDQPYEFDLTCYNNDGGDCEEPTCEWMGQITCPDASCGDSLNDCHECTNYTITVDGGVWPEEISWHLHPPIGDVISGGAPYTNNDICFLKGNHTLLMTDSYGDGWNDNAFQITEESGNEIISLTLLNESSGSGFSGMANFCLPDINCCLANSAGGSAGDCHQVLYNLNLNFANADYAAINSPFGDLTPDNGINTADPVIIIKLANSIPITGYEFDLLIYPGVEIVRTLITGGVGNENGFKILMDNSFIKIIGTVNPCTADTWGTECHTLLLVLSNENTSQNNNGETVTISNFQVSREIPDAGITEEVLALCDINNSPNCNAEDTFYTPNYNCRQDAWAMHWPNLMGCQLTEANLTGNNFEGANLTNANLKGATLVGANFSEANLTNAILINANLSTANLQGALLAGANLQEANLTGANLTNAILINANLSTANLTGANLTGALICDTIGLTTEQLSQTIGGAPHIDIDDCGVCGGDNSSCDMDCGPNQAAALSYCEDTDGDGQGAGDSAEYCLADLPGGWVLDCSDLEPDCATNDTDDCGVCGGDNSSCDIGCGPNQAAALSYCVDTDGDGLGAGNSSDYCLADIPDGWVLDCSDPEPDCVTNDSDDCGVCGGDNSSCDIGCGPNQAAALIYCEDTDGDGQGAGDSAEYCLADLPDGWVIDCSDLEPDCATNDTDDCGVCGGDNSSCDIGCGPNQAAALIYCVDTDGDGQGAGDSAEYCLADLPGGWVLDCSDLEPDCATNDTDDCGMCGGDNSSCDMGCGPNQAAALIYCEDTDGDGQGAGDSAEYCLADLPGGWVLDCSDPEPDCVTNDSDDCGVCGGDNSSCDMGCGTNQAAALSYCEDTDGDGLGAGNSSDYCLADIPDGWVLDCSDPEPDCVTNDSDDCGVCGGDNSSCDMGCGPNQAAALIYCEDTDGDGQGAGDSAEYCLADLPGDWVLDCSDLEPDCATNDTDGCGVCGGDNSSCDMGCGPNQAAALSYCEDTDGDGLGTGDSSDYCLADIPDGWVLDCSDLEPDCATNDTDDCGVCGGDNSSCDMGCGTNQAAALSYCEDTDSDGLGTGDSSDYCLADIPDGWVLDCSDLEPDCATNDTDDCGVCGGGNADNLGCGCFEPAALSYCVDTDSDGLGTGDSSDYCLADIPDGWVLDCSDPEPACTTNDTDDCGVCGGGNADNLGCGCFEPAALSYCVDTDSDGLGTGDSSDYCLADIPDGWVLDCSDPEPACVTNDTDDCGVCGGDNSSCDMGCGPNQAAALSYCVDTDSDGLGTGDSSDYCLADIPDGWVLDCSDPEPDCVTNDTDDCGVCGGDNSSCDIGCGPNQAAALIYCEDTDGDGQGAGDPSDYCLADIPDGWVLDCSDPEPACATNDTDDCGVCGGDNSSCDTNCGPNQAAALSYCVDTDSDGLGTGDSSDYCLADLPDGWVLDCSDPEPACATNDTDDCGVCGGDNSSCDIGCGPNQAAALSYCVDTDGDGLGAGNSSEYCLADLPDGWVLDCSDPEPACATNDTDDCGVCGGGNADNLGCGCFEPAALSYCVDTDNDGLGAGESAEYCLADIPEGWLLDCSDPEPDCATNDTDDCGVCGGDNSSCDIGCGPNQAAALIYCEDTDGDGQGAGDSAEYCLADLPGDWVLDCSDLEPDCATNDTDDCGVCGGDNSSCDMGCGTNQAAALSYCEDTDGDGLGAGNSSDYCLADIPDGWVLDCSDPEPACTTNDTDDCGVCGGGNADNLGCGCFEPAALSYCVDTDSDGLGTGDSSDYCLADIPDGWVLDCSDPEPACVTNDTDDCGVCGGDNSSCDIGCGPNQAAALSYCVDTDNDGLGAGESAEYCLADIPEGWLLDCSDPEPDCATNDTDDCGVCGGDNSSCDIGCGPNQAAALIYCEDTDGDGQGAGGSAEYCLADLPGGWVLDCSDLEPDCATNDTDDCGVCGGDNSSCDMGCGPNQAAALSYCVDTDGDGLGTGDSSDYCLADLPGGWVLDCSDLEPDCATNDTDDCGVCGGDNSSCDIGCGPNQAAALIYCEDTDGDGQGAGDSAEYCLADIPEGWLLDCSDPEPDCVTNDTDDCGVCGGDNSSCDMGCGTNQAAALSYCVDTDNDGLGAGESAKYCLADIPEGWLLDCSDPEPDCVTNDTDDCGVCGGDNSSCGIGCGPNQAAALIYCEDTDGDGQGAGDSAEYCLADLPDGWVIDCSDLEPDCATNDTDDCGVCGGDNSSCDIGCGPNQAAALIYCEDTDGDGQGAGDSAEYCLADLPGGWVLDCSDLEPDCATNDTDDCGVCGGDNSSCDMGCGPNQAAALSYCVDTDGDGLGAGNSSDYCLADIPEGWLLDCSDLEPDCATNDTDDCGVCGGDNSSCDVGCGPNQAAALSYCVDTDNDGLGAGNSSEYCLADIPEGWLLDCSDPEPDCVTNDTDDCGVCGGNNSSCDMGCGPNQAAALSYCVDTDGDQQGAGDSAEYCLADLPDDWVLDCSDPEPDCVTNDTDDCGVCGGDNSSCDMGCGPNQAAALSYCVDTDNDGLGAGNSSEYCLADLPDGWVLDCSDPEPACATNDTDDCGVCGGDNSSCDVGCGTNQAAALSYCVDTDGDGLGAGNSSDYCLADLPEGWLLDCSDPEPDCVTNDTDDCGVCGGDNSSCDIGCGPNQAAALIYCEDTDGDGQGAGDPSDYCLADIPDGWVLDCSDPEPACATNDTDDCGVCGGDNSSCDTNCGPNQAAALSYCVDTDGDGLGAGNSSDYCLVDLPDGWVLYCSDPEPDCVTNDTDDCGVCGGDNSSCDMGCGPNQAAALSYCVDTDSDGLGTGDSSDYCLADIPDGWVLDCSDPEPDCATNDTDDCGVCGGDNSSCDVGCGPNQAAALSYCEDTDGDGLGAGNSFDYCLADIPEDWVLYCSDPEPDCVTNDTDDCGVCGGDNSSCDMGCGPNQAAALSYCVDIDNDGLGAGESAEYCLADIPEGWLLECSDPEPDCVTNDTDDCGVCGGDNSSCDVGCGPNQAAALSYCVDIDNDGLGAGDSAEYCLADIPYGWVLDCSDLEPDCTTNDTDNCGVCGGDNSSCDVGCGPNQVAALSYCEDTDGDGLGAGDSSDYCLADLPGGWVLYCSDPEPDCATNDSDDCGVCGGDNSSCDMGCGTNQAAALSYCVDTDNDGLGAGESAEYCLADIPEGWLLDCSDLEPDCATNDTDDCGVCGGDNSSCDVGCGPNQAAALIYCEDTDGDGQGAGESAEYCLADLPEGWVLDCSDPEPACATNDTDDCGVCGDNDASNDCEQDCAGEWGGTASNWLETGVCLTQEEYVLVSQQYVHDILDAFTAGVESVLNGDLNNDSTVNILDIISLVNIILATSEPILDTENDSDMNGDSIIDILDVVKLTDTILDDDAIF